MSGEHLAISEIGLDALAMRIMLGVEATRSAEHRRYIVGIAGIGGSGKSTFAQALLDRIRAEAGREFAQLAPMDGFHLPNQTLDELGIRRRKGAPDTFDAAAFICLLSNARHPKNRDRPLYFPRYDRTRHEPVTGNDPEHTIGPATALVLTEGNYLLLDEAPWSKLADILDECWFLDTPLEQAKSWIIARHVKGGRDEADAAAHYERADLPNARRVLSKRRAPTLILRWSSPGPRSAEAPG